MKPRILFIAPQRGITFVEHDIEILGNHYDMDLMSRSDYPRVRYFLIELTKRLLSRRTALVFIWFADPSDSYYISLIVKALRRKLVFVTGGYDVASMPEIDYGVLHVPSYRRNVIRALSMADSVLPFSEFSRYEVEKLTPPRRIKVIYPGVNLSYYCPNGSVREPFVITAGTVSKSVYRRKGLDQFAKCSKLVPEARFILAGRIQHPEIAEKLKELGGPNLELTGRFLEVEELRSLFRKSAIYAQLSAQEGFGLALAEAMACGCLPLSSNVGSLPEVVGDCVELIPYGDTCKAAEVIRKWLTQSTDDLRQKAIRRVQTVYPLARRKTELLQEIDQVLTAGK